MSKGVIIIKRQNDNKNNQKSYGKWYPRVLNMKTLTLDDVCDHIMEHGTIFTADVVHGVTKKFVNCIQELLLDSHKVKLDGQYEPTQKGYLLKPVNGVIALDLGRYVD